MLNFGSKPSQDASLRKIAIWGADLVLCSAPKFGPHPGGSYGGRGGLSFYVGGKGRQWTQISHRKLKNSISHSVVILASEPDTMLRGSLFQAQNKTLAQIVIQGTNLVHQEFTFTFGFSSTLCYIHIFMHVYLFRYISFPRIHSRKEPQDFNFLRV